MSSQWSARLFRRARAGPAPPVVPPALTEAFFDMDKRQSVAESAVDASEQLFPERRLRQSWEPVVAVCYAAAAAYLAATAQPDEGSRREATPAGGSGSLDATRQQLIAASQAVDEFYGAHRAHLEHAQALLSAVPADAQQAATVADTVRRRLESSVEPYVDYPSVRASSTALHDAVGALDAALTTGNGGSIRAAAARLRDAAAVANEALDRAPERERLAAQSLASVTTRMAAVSTRAEGLAPALSSLLREFNAASSEDLVTNERESRRILGDAAAELTQARAALSSGDPERAAHVATSIRALLADAEELVDAVTDRLVLLRSVRANPRAKEDEVRFKLRDAQMLAVGRGVVKEWASVLDAQLERIDRVVDGLAGRNPDYWGYVSGLDAVSTFISGVVQRMRTESTEQSGPGTR